MKYGFNTRYGIEEQEIKGHGNVFFVRKEHRDDIVILDERSLALIERVKQKGGLMRLMKMPLLSRGWLVNK